MLAYVFWHRPAAGVDTDAYEEALAAFHRALAAAPPAGFERSHCHCFAALPWLDDSPGYEDWYLVRDWPAVGALEAGAMRGSVRGPHDLAASASAEGAGAVYGIAAGDAAGLGSGERAWFAKPAGRSYAELDELLAPALGDGAGLWRRRLVLGPAPEQCLAGAAAAPLPAELEPVQAVGTLIHT